MDLETELRKGENIVTELLNAQGKRVDSVGSKMRQMEIALANAQLANAQIWGTLKNTIAQIQIQSQVLEFAFKKLGISLDEVFEEYKNQPQPSAEPEEIPTDPVEKPV